MIFNGFNGEHRVVCQRCDSVEVFTTADWQGLMDEMRDSGWTKRRDRESGEWVHFCPDCSRQRTAQAGR